MVGSDKDDKPKKAVVNNFYGKVTIRGTKGTTADGGTFRVGIDIDEDDDE